LEFLNITSLKRKLLKRTLFW